jgi:S-methylmethionine-dependent homocysteine/selenocysteine methylase
MGVNKLKKHLAQGKTVLMDGAMGSEIHSRGVSTKLPLWSAEALITEPEVVRRIHEDYIRSDAEIIITNTFSTTDRILKRGRAKHSGRELTVLACHLAQQARGNVGAKHDVYIAGSVAPLEDCYSPELTPPEPELEKEHRAMAGDLHRGGVDFILIETMITLRETLAALRAARETGLPVAVSFCCNERGQLLSGEPLEEVIPAVEEFNPLFIGVNCVSPAIATKTVRELKRLTQLPISVYAQGEGEPDDDDGWHSGKDLKVEAYLRAAKRWLADGALIIGGCCGTTPEHTARLKTLLAGHEAEG